MKRWAVAAAAVLGGLALGVLLTRGPDPDVVPTTDEVAARMMSPFCPGLTLEECPSDQSSRLRSEIDVMVREGSTNEQIDRWIVDNFGEVALARPRGSAAWLAPPALALVGLGAVLLVLRRKPRDTEPATLELSPADESLFEKDFGNFRRGSE
jgi:cytochrome c-type biogenesis protein CcmH/NrfF